MLSSSLVWVHISGTRMRRVLRDHLDSRSRRTPTASQDVPFESPSQTRVRYSQRQFWFGGDSSMGQEMCFIQLSASVSLLHSFLHTFLKPLLNISPCRALSQKQGGRRWEGPRYCPGRPSSLVGDQSGRQKNGGGLYRHLDRGRRKCGGRLERLSLPEGIGKTTKKVIFQQSGRSVSAKVGCMEKPKTE